MRNNHTYVKWGICLVVMVMVLSGSTVYAGYHDVYISLTEPADPVYDEGWTWDDWDRIGNIEVGDVFPIEKTLDPGAYLWLGLGNAQLPDRIKTVTLEFWSAGIVPVGYETGYEDGTADTWSMSLVDSTATYRKWEGTIDPQPGWEWVKLQNQLTTAQTIRITNFTSACSVPEPSTIGLLALGSLSILRRRKVA